LDFFEAIITNTLAQKKATIYINGGLRVELAPHDNENHYTQQN